MATLAVSEGTQGTPEDRDRAASIARRATEGQPDSGSHRRGSVRTLVVEDEAALREQLA